MVNDLPAISTFWSFTRHSSKGSEKVCNRDACFCHVTQAFQIHPTFRNPLCVTGEDSTARDEDTYCMHAKHNLGEQRWKNPRSL